MSKTCFRCGAPATSSLKFAHKAKKGCPVTYSSTSTADTCNEHAVEALGAVSKEAAYFANWIEAGEQPAKGTWIGASEEEGKLLFSAPLSSALAEELRGTDNATVERILQMGLEAHKISLGIIAASTECPQ
jgi:hypothetical protein